MDLEASTQFFGFEPTKFIDDVINFVASYLRSGLEELDKALQSEYPQRKAQITKSVRQLRSTLDQSFAVAFDRFELYLAKNIFTVPEQPVPNPLTDADAAAVASTSPHDVSDKQKRLAYLTARVTEARAKNAWLKTAVTRLEQCKSAMRNVLEESAFLSDEAHEKQRRELVESVAQIVNLMAANKDAVETLHRLAKKHEVEFGDPLEEAPEAKRRRTTTTDDTSKHMFTV
jgi:hypothetical protein